MLEHYQKFYLADTDELREEIARLGLKLPVTEDLSPLATPLEVQGHPIANRLWLQPIQGFDAEPDGTPGPLTCRRYARYAAGGFGLLWIEATAMDPEARAHQTQLCLHEGTVEAFTDLVKDLRKVSDHTTLILQLALTGKDAPEDQEHEALLERYVRSAQLAAAAGFDGVDIKCISGDPLFALMASQDREGRFLQEILKAIKAQVPELILASRLTVYDARPHPQGFGVDSEDYRQSDLSEPVQLLNNLGQAGLSLLNPSIFSPNLHTPGDPPLAESAPPQEHPLTVLARRLELMQSIRDAVPGLRQVGGGMSWLRQFIPQVGAAIIQEGIADAIGFGRSAMAYPDAAAVILESGAMDPKRCCMVCFACSELAASSSPVGCAVREPETYGTAYRHQRRFDMEHLHREARRCHDCEAAPCITASPSGLDIPGFIRHFIAEQYDRAYEVVRQSNVFPEMSAHLCPAWMQAEAACIETTLTGQPVPIRDLQLTLARWALDHADVGVRVPDKATGKRVAVVGGGPAGLAASVRLLEQGHAVVLFERADRLGGMPDLVISSTRFPGAQREIEAVLQPAVAKERLDIKFGRELGQDFSINELAEQYDAVLLATGLWEETKFGEGPGVVDALTFLREVKRGERTSVPPRVAILSGGDCAMDAGRIAQAMGAEQIFIVFEGPRAEMHWHMEESWFAEEGIHCLILSKPLGYEVDEAGQLTGLRMAHLQPGLAEAAGEHILQVDLVIEAMGLKIASPVQRALDKAGVVLDPASFTTGHDKIFACGALCNGGASVEQCIAEGLKAADEIGETI